MNDANDANPTDNEPLLALRARIDALDVDIQRLLNERARCALEVAEVKLAAEGERAQFYRPEREAQVLRRIQQRNEGPLPANAVARLFREIISSCMALEKTLVVGYSRGHVLAQTAALRHFGQAVRTEPYADVVELAAAVADGAVDHGVLALDELLQVAAGMPAPAKLLLCGEVKLRTAASDADVPPSSRFLVLGTRSVAPSGHDKTALLVGLKDRPGELLKLLEPLAQINLNVVEAAQTPGRFWVELDGHRDDQVVAAALAALDAQTLDFRVLGSYPACVF